MIRSIWISARYRFERRQGSFTDFICFDSVIDEQRVDVAEIWMSELPLRWRCYGVGGTFRCFPKISEHWCCDSIATERCISKGDIPSSMLWSHRLSIEHSLDHWGNIVGLGMGGLLRYYIFVKDLKCTDQSRRFVMSYM